MTAYAATEPRSTAIAPTTDAIRGNERISFAHLVRSEWVKLVSVRSTWWTLGLTILGMVGMSLLMAVSVAALVDGVPAEEIEGMSTQVVTFGFFLGQITVAVLGALAITGEYSTGMIRSTFAAAPRRLDALSAKAVVLAVVVFVVGIVGGLISWVVTIPLLPSGLAASFSEPLSWRALVGLAVYLVLITLMAFAIGVIVRSSAGAIAAVLGLLLMLPLAFQILSAMGQSWASTVMTYLPSEAGARLMSTNAEFDQSMVDYTVLAWWQGGLVLVAYVVALGAVGAVAVRRRDA